MSGTNRKAIPVLGGPAVVLVRPQMGENIGAAARAMLNFGLTEMRLVAPRDGWPNPAALALASGADRIIETARLYGTLETALADIRFAVATTARGREMEQLVLEPGAAAGILRTRFEADESCALVFGPEAAGLTNEEVALADLLVTIPTNPAFASLNLGQAVLILGYAWFTARSGTHRGVARAVAPPAHKAELFGLFDHLERELDRLGFLHPPEKKPAMMRNLKAMLSRAQFTEQDVRTLRGVVAALTGAKLKK